MFRIAFTQSLAAATMSIMLMASPASAADRCVPSTYPTVQAAIDAADDNDTIMIEPGAYSGPGNTSIDLNGKRLIIMGTSGGAYEHVFFGGPIFNISPSEAPESIIVGLSFFAPYGNVRVDGASVQFVDCRFDSSGEGTGVRSEDATLHFWGCEFSGCSIGIDDRRSEILINNCEFWYSTEVAVRQFQGGSFNASDADFYENARALFVETGSASTLSWCLFERNLAIHRDRESYNGITHVRSDSPVVVRDCWFKDNIVI